MSDARWVDPDVVEIGRLGVEQMYPTDDGIETFAYTLVFVQASDDDVRRLIADEIRLLGKLEIALDDIDGTAFIAGVIASATEQDIPIVPSPPVIEADLTLVSYLSGGVDILYGSPTPWDPSMFCLRFEGEIE